MSEDQRRRLESLMSCRLSDRNQLEQMSWVDSMNTQRGVDILWQIRELDIQPGDQVRYRGCTRWYQIKSIFVAETWNYPWRGGSVSYFDAGRHCGFASCDFGDVAEIRKNPGFGSDKPEAGIALCAD